MPYYGQNYMYGYQNPQNTYQNLQGGYQTPQNGYQTSFVHVQSENEARAYPVAPNNSVTFIDENRPYLYTKTADASQLGGSRFEKYRLEKEATEGSSGFQEKQYNVSDFATKQQIEALEKKISVLEERLNEPRVKSEHYQPISDVYAEPRSILNEPKT